MSDSLLNTQPVKDLLRKVSGLDNDSGDARLKRIVHRVVSDLFRTIEEFDVQPDEFWSAMSYLTSLGQANETGLLVPGLGLEPGQGLAMRGVPGVQQLDGDLTGQHGIGGPPHLAVPAGTDGFIKDVTTGKQRRGMDHQRRVPAEPDFNHRGMLA